MAVPRWVWDKNLTDEERLAMIREEIRVEKIIWKYISIAAFTILLSTIAIGGI